MSARAHILLLENTQAHTHKEGRSLDKQIINQRRIVVCDTKWDFVICFVRLFLFVPVHILFGVCVFFLRAVRAP